MLFGSSIASAKYNGLTNLEHGLDIINWLRCSSGMVTTDCLEIYYMQYYINLIEKSE